ncbi:hypothetical protein [Nostoc sp. CALU 546]
MKVQGEIIAFKLTAPNAIAIPVKTMRVIANNSKECGRGFLHSQGLAHLG